MERPIPASAVLKPEAIPQYRTDGDLLWSQTVALNANLYLLERLSRFPFDLFIGGSDLCWTLFEDSLYESSLLAIWRIAVDTGRDFLTLRRLRAFVFENSIPGESIDKIRRELGELDFDGKMKAVETQIRTLRHSWHAHLRSDAAAARDGTIPAAPNLPLPQLQEIAEHINAFSRILSFDWGRGFIYMEYEPAVVHARGSDGRSDIERELDDIAFNSDLLHMPERVPRDWPHQRKLLSEGQLEQLNLYRRKLDLPDA